MRRRSEATEERQGSVEGGIEEETEVGGEEEREEAVLREAESVTREPSRPSEEGGLRERITGGEMETAETFATKAKAYEEEMLKLTALKDEIEHFQKRVADLEAEREERSRAWEEEKAGLMEKFQADLAAVKKKREETIEELQKSLEEKRAAYKDEKSKFLAEADEGRRRLLQKFEEEHEAEKKRSEISFQNLQRWMEERAAAYSAEKGALVAA
ncbi:MAG: hypothetical protein AABX40_04530, partial [Candidatus Hydrothermarchaeota archaeon]